MFAQSEQSHDRRLDACAVTRTAMQYDLLVSGGHVLDPDGGMDDVLDVAVSRGRIADVAPSIAPDRAARVIDAAGTYVTPGLIDLHTHVFSGVGYFGVDADSLAWQSGVTTWVDAGSAGAFALPGFHEYVVRPASSRILAFINVSYLGLAGLNYDEYCNPRFCDVDVLVRAVEQYRDLVVGVKVRMGTEGVCGGQMEPLIRGLRAAEACGLPLMCHLSEVPPPVDDILPLLRPGDVVTHAFTGLSERIIDDAGRLRDSAREARERGVLFDIGHGAGSFSFITAEALASQGFWPDVISTDLHQASVHGPNMVEDPNVQEQDLVTRVRGDGSPAFTLLTVMSKFLHLGMPLVDVVRATTSRPAAVVGMSGQIGTLRPGAVADIALLTAESGDHVLFDIHGNRRRARVLLRSRETIAAGRPMPRRAFPPPPPWIRLVDREVTRP
jgi:dihydroorotase